MLSAAIATNAHAHTTGNETWTTIIFVALVLLWPALGIWFLRRHDDSDDADENGGSPGPPPDSPDPAGPTWWPEFERDFAAYVDAVGSRR